MEEVIVKAESSCVHASGAYFTSCAKLCAAAGTLLLQFLPLHLKPAHMTAAVVLILSTHVLWGILHRYILSTQEREKDEGIASVITN